jgi:hypothetical protein
VSDLPFPVPDQPLGPHELATIARLVAEAPQLWEPGLDPRREERTYREVHSSEHLGVWAIAWAADDHDTGYHDHDRSDGAVHVARGCIRHEHLRLGTRPVGRGVPAGEGFRFDSTVIHRMRREPGHDLTVTIHAYSPPLVETGQYHEHDDALLHRVPTASTEQLRPQGFQGDPSGTPVRDDRTDGLRRPG